MTTATGPIRVTRGTFAKLENLTKDKPGRLVASIDDTDATKHRLYLESGGMLRGLAWADEVGGGGNGGDTGTDSGSDNVGTTGNPIFNISIASSASSPVQGQSIKLTANGNVIPGSISEYQWLLADGSTATGREVTIIAHHNDTIGVKAVSDGHHSAYFYTLITAVQPPSGSSGLLGPGTHTVDIPQHVQTITLIGKGGDGFGVEQCITINNGYDRSCYISHYIPGGDTAIWIPGAESLAFPGGTHGAASESTIVKDISGLTADGGITITAYVSGSLIINY